MRIIRSLFDPDDKIAEADKLAREGGLTFTAINSGYLPIANVFVYDSKEYPFRNISFTLRAE